MNQTRAIGYNDKGIDVEATKDDGTKEVIQVKQYSPENKIGSKDVRRYATLYQQVDADNVVLVTSSTFTGPARDLGDDLDVTLIDGNGVERMVERTDVDMDNIAVERRSDGLTGAGKLALGTGLFILFVLALAVFIPVFRAPLKMRYGGRIIVSWQSF